MTHRGFREFVLAPNAFTPPSAVGARSWGKEVYEMVRCENENENLDEEESLHDSQVDDLDLLVQSHGWLARSSPPGLSDFLPRLVR